MADPTPQQPQAQESPAPPTTNQPTGSPKPRHLVRRVVLTLVALVLALVAYLLAGPARIDPVAYDPPPIPPLEGPYEPNDRLRSAEIIAAGQVQGPEDVDVDSAGNIITGTADGRVVRIDPEGKLATIVETGGRPVGIARAPDGKLIVADAVKGLLSIAEDCTMTTLVARTADNPLGFADDVDVASDGMIYFSDASSKFGADQYLLDMLESRPHGRLLRYDPASKKTSTLVDELYFANGVALSQHEDFVLVAETYRYRIKRYWLKGERAGQVDTFIDNLPGFPDNVTSNRRGNFWVAIFSIRNADADWLAPRPYAKKVLSKLPAFMWPKPQPYGFVVKLDEAGQVVETLQDPSGEPLYAITSAFERDGWLYLGSLQNDRIGKYRLP